MCSRLYPCLQADHLTRRGKPLPQQESLEIELAEEKPTKRSVITVEELTEIERLEDLDTCMVRHIPLPIQLSMQILEKNAFQHVIWQFHDIRKLKLGIGL